MHRGMVVFNLTLPMLPVLNLPPMDARIIGRDGGRKFIFDALRRRYVPLTPEEWVRQNFVHFLITEKHYPRSLMANEVELRLNSTRKRCDTVVYDRGLRPRMIVEYKAPSVAIGQQVFDQISRYNIVLRVDYLLVSNGMEHYCCRIDYERGTYTFMREIPTFDGHA